MRWNTGTAFFVVLRTVLLIGLLSTCRDTGVFAEAEGSGEPGSSLQRATTESKPLVGLEVYRPKVALADIYFVHPAARPLLKYNHDVDIVKFKGRFLASWNANEVQREGVPGQFNYLSVSDDFESWSRPVRLFAKAGGAESPVEDDNQWQPSFINYHDRVLYCAWCTFTGRRTFISTSMDGLRWSNREVAGAPAELEGKVVGFPTAHGLSTSKGVMMFPCSLPFASGRFLVGSTRYAGVLFSEDGGKSWHWSKPIEAVEWSDIGEDPAKFGGETIYLWEPVLFEQADGRIGLLIRNSTAQEEAEREEKPHRMILYATSDDHGRTWTKARPIEVDSICSRIFAAAGVTSPESLLMVMNDNHVRIPERISSDRYFLSLYFAPVCNPDLLLPGPLVQPEGGTAFYPNGFVEDGRLYLAYTYPPGIQASIIEPLPDFSKPFLLPREGRPGLHIEDGIAYFGHRQSSLGLVLTAELTREPRLRLAFDMNVHRYSGGGFPLLTIGGKTRQGTEIRAIYDEQRGSDVLLVKEGSQWVELAPLEMKTWKHFEIEIAASEFSVSVDGSDPRLFQVPLLRKICFGGLYERPDWPMGMTRSSDIRLKLDSIVAR